MLKSYNMRNVIATIGIFDGVHRGHQKILKKLVREARRLKTKSLVISFHPHPRKILNPDSKIPFLISLKHKENLIKDLGIDFFYMIKFTKPFLRMRPEDFIKKFLINKFGIKALVVGKDFSFGYKEEGDFALLKKMSKKYGFHLFGIDPVKVKGEPVSSTRIRRYIEKGDFKNASLMLGRPVVILGSVVKGRHIGRQIGFPTANINPHHEAIPPSGVYAVDVKIGKKLYPAVVNIGMRPTFGKYKDPTIEIHIVDFKKNIYGKDVEIIFKKKIRDEKRFSSIEALRRQIQKDVLRAA